MLRRDLRAGSGVLPVEVGVASAVRLRRHKTAATTMPAHNNTPPPTPMPMAATESSAIVSVVSLVVNSEATIAGVVVVLIDVALLGKDVTAVAAICVN